MFIARDDIIVGWSSENGKRPPINSFSDYRLIDDLAVSVVAFTQFYIDISGRKHAVNLGGLQLLDCNIGDDLEYLDNVWSVVSDNTVAQSIAAAKIKQLNNEFTQSLSVLTDPYPAVERESWRIQESEARAYVADNAASIPFIDVLVAAEQVTVANKVAEIIEKADAFRVVVAAAVGKRQRLEDQVNTLAVDSNLTLQQKTDQINAVGWS